MKEFVIPWNFFLHKTLIILFFRRKEFLGSMVAIGAFLDKIRDLGLYIQVAEPTFQFFSSYCSCIYFLQLV